MAKDAAPAPAGRSAFIDVARGFAVLFMIQWHCLDAWLSPEARKGFRWDILVLIGGLAAPSFVFLAGAGVGLKLSADARKGIPPLTTFVGLAKRSAVIFVLGYLLHLQLVLTDGSKLRGVFRFDVLQCIALSLLVAAAVGALARLLPRAPAAMAAIGLLVLVVTPLVASLVPGPLPDAVAAGIARPTGQAARGSLAMFPLFPWMEHALVGSALGVVWDRAVREKREAWSLFAWSVVGACAIALGADAAPWMRASVHAIEGYDATPIARHITRDGAVMMIVAGSLVLARLLPRASGVLVTLGRASLPVYWVHVVIAYSTISSPLKRRLDLGTGLALVAAMTAAMYVVALIRLGPYERLLAALKKRRSKTGEDRA